jgi:hypothetical protein
MIQVALGHGSQARALLGRALAINPHFSILGTPIAWRTLHALGAAP